MYKKEKLNEDIEELSKIKIAINDIKKNYQNIDKNAEIKKDVRKMIDILDKIYIEIFNNSHNLRLFNMYGDFYLPTISKIVSRYNNLSKKDIWNLMKKIKYPLNMNTEIIKKEH